MRTDNPILNPLLSGDHRTSSEIVTEMLNKSVPVKELYEGLLKPALYKIGELWEQNKISVATEHLASAIVESLLNEIYLRQNSSQKSEKTAIVTCLENEHHQIGARMVSDIFELNGWKVFFLGANTPKNDLLNYIRMVKPQIVAISLSIYFHLPTLELALYKIRSEFSQLPVLIGGQAFLRGGHEILSEFDYVTYLPDLNAIENFINQNENES
jgi:MerR family transcriptional regulator, light-induced transcriptional regulator